MEFVGEGVASLSMSDRLTMTNMAIEAGAKNGIFAVDDQTLAYVAEHSDRKPVVYTADEDAVYEEKSSSSTCQKSSLLLHSRICRATPEPLMKWAM